MDTTPDYCSYGDDCMYDNDDDEITELGTSFSIQGGVMLFRTYDINVLARARYLHIFNSYSDNGLVVDIVFQKKVKQRQRNRVVNRYPLIELLLD